ncbi:MAG: homoserine kinase [Magnetococcales bacterium]|nr:homoserine kinase [Magnetococcales bacterium]
MSVYTLVQVQDLEPFTSARHLGHPVSLEAIAQGIINSNYRLTTSHGTFILTLVENRPEVEALPFIMGLLEQLHRAGIPVPCPLKDADGAAVFTLHGRPAVIVTLLPGISPDVPVPSQCRQLGSMLGSIHLQGRLPHDSPQFTRSDRTGWQGWEVMLRRLDSLPNPEHQKTIAWLDMELLWLKHHWLTLDLPSGLCHGDLFPDNTLFVDDRLSGIIDFYSASHGPWLYDLAISLCSWCLDDQGQPHPELILALLEGYDRIRPRTRTERDHLTTACRAAAFRFSLSRFHDHCFPRSGTTVTRRNPESFMARLRFLQSSPLPMEF